MYYDQKRQLLLSCISLSLVWWSTVIRWRWTCFLSLHLGTHFFSRRNQIRIAQSQFLAQPWTMMESSGCSSSTGCLWLHISNPTTYSCCQGLVDLYGSTWHVSSCRRCQLRYWLTHHFRSSEVRSILFWIGLNCFFSPPSPPLFTCSYFFFCTTASITTDYTLISGNDVPGALSTPFHVGFLAQSCGSLRMRYLTNQEDY